MRIRLSAILLSAAAAAFAQEPAPAPRPDLSGEIYVTPINKTLGPWVFSGFRPLERRPFTVGFPDPAVARQVWRDSIGCIQEPPSLPEEGDLTAADGGVDLEADSLLIPEIHPEIPSRDELTVAFGDVTPDWLRRAVDAYRIQEDLMYEMMLEHPEYIDYAYWDLPEPPRLPEEDFSFRGYLKRLNITLPTPAEKLPVHASGERINWLHKFDIALQLSQAYLSSNWYQGGNSYLAFMGNFAWDVQLNQVYYPKLLFQSTVSYKLAINSTEQDECHKYSVSEDLFQYNLRAGYKAVHNWYYSFLTQFKTQMLASYPANSMTRTASFLSPGQLNVGLGMTYTKENKKKTLKFAATISPIAYNLTTCIDPKVDHAQFNIEPDRKTVSVYGSNAEVNFFWRFLDNVTYTTKLFLFSDYHKFQGDWENTLNFQFGRFFSTQLYAHLRYDTSYDSSINPAWRKWMLREILSVGLSYSFSTK